MMAGGMKQRLLSLASAAVVMATTGGKLEETTLATLLPRAFEL